MKIKKAVPGIVNLCYRGFCTICRVFQFVGKMNIEAPEYVRRSYAGYLEEALDDALGGRKAMKYSEDHSEVECSFQ